jgi:protease-4
LTRHAWDYNQHYLVRLNLPEVAMPNKLVSWIGKLNPIRPLRYVRHCLGNVRRRWAKVDYLLFTLPATMPTLPKSRGFLLSRVLGRAPLSLWELDQLFERLAADPRPKGVVLHLRGFRMSLADLQTLRDSILRLRERGKRVICYAQGYDTAAYYVASAADEILLQPGGELNTIGLHEQAMFFKDSLAAAGIVLDVVAISPFKSAFDQWAKNEASPEFHEQVNWLLDSRFEMIVGGIAEGRRMATKAVRQMIDNAPHTDQQALSAGYVDRLINEEALPDYLGAKHFVSLAEANKVLFKKWRKASAKYVAVLIVEGLIISGQSASPPGGNPLPLPIIGGSRAGDLTVVRQIRALIKDKRAAALILCIDSGGGSAAASEAMASALKQLAKERPVVVYMGGVAASGGYYIATPAQWIVAQPGTITGSIGVINAKPVTGDLWHKLHAHSVAFTRGANADILSEDYPFTDPQRAKIRESIERVYQLFLDHVATARHMTIEAVDSIGAGRVWTGKQAAANGLVDELGGLHAAIAKARTLAGLPEDAQMVMVKARGKALAPPVAEPAAVLRYMYENLNAICNGNSQLLMPVEWMS